MRHIECTYTNGFENQLWELPSIHLTTRGERSITTDLTLKVKLGLAMLFKISG